MNFGEICIFLALFVGVSYSLDEGGYKTLEEDDLLLSKFINNWMMDWKNSAIENGFEPIADEKTRDLFLINNQFMISGNVSDFKYAGLSDLEDLQTPAHYTMTNDSGVYEGRGGYEIAFTVPNVVLSGKFKLDGHVMVAGEKVPLMGEGVYTIQGQLAVNDSFKIFVKDDHVDPYSILPSIEFLNLELDLPGLINGEIPADVGDIILISIREEVLKIYDNLLRDKSSVSIWTDLQQTFKEISLTEILGQGHEVHSRTKRQWWPPASIWQVDLFLEKTMNELRESGVLLPLEPIQDLYQRINVTYPEYLQLAGQFTNLTYKGVAQLKYESSYSQLGIFFLTCEIVDGVLSGQHNLAGTIDLEDENGTVLNVSGDKVFSLQSTGTFILDLTFEVDLLSRIHLADASYSYSIALKNEGYTVDLGGLLDGVEDPNKNENAGAWITDAVVENLELEILEKILYRLVAYLGYAFDQTTWREIMNTPPTSI